MSQSGPNLRTQLADRTLNESRTVGAATISGGGQVVNVSIVFQGRAFNAEDIFDALETKYGSGKVTSDLDVTARGNMRLRIVP